MGVTMTVAVPVVMVVVMTMMRVAPMMRMIVAMSVVRINAITVTADSGDELARRVAARAGAVDDQDGFEGFELLKPTDGRTTWLVVTRWRDEQAFQTWMLSRLGHGKSFTTDKPMPVPFKLDPLAARPV